MAHGSKRTDCACFCAVAALSPKAQGLVEVGRPFKDQDRHIQPVRGRGVEAEHVGEDGYSGLGTLRGSPGRDVKNVCLFPH